MAEILLLSLSEKSLTEKTLPTAFCKRFGVCERL